MTELAIIFAIVTAGIVLVAIFGGGIRIGNGRDRSGSVSVETPTGNARLEVDARPRSRSHRS